MKALKNYKLSPFSLFLLAILVTFFFSCNNKQKDVTQTEMVEQPEDINASAEKLIRSTLTEILSGDRELPDSFHVKNASILQHLYEQNSFEPLWSLSGSFTRNGDSLYSLISSSMKYGLFPDDYYYTRLTGLRNQFNDTSSTKKLDASLWAYSDLLLSSAFVQIVKDLKVGRLLPDSIISNDSTLTPDFFSTQVHYFQQRKDSVFEMIEPVHLGYQKIKAALPEFLSKANFKDYTLITTEDSTKLPELLYKRLQEEDSSLIEFSPDSLQVAIAIRKYQRKRKLKVDGKLSSSLISRLNNTDKQKFIRIAINLDRYKLLGPLPEQYLWVNIPSYYLQLMQADTVALKSKVVVGKPTTKTPVITSAISDMITYPKWTIPESIIKKEILPGLKKDAGYTIRKGYSLIDKDGNEVDPYEVRWSKYESFIPYKVVQGSGDDNALGVLKFNFPNKYSVYLHDTNQRYLFGNKNRALSHGCVRVQAWNELAQFILRNDSLNSVNAVPVDSLESWLASKQKKYIPVRKRIPLFIRYFTCDTTDEGKLVFYEDIYEEDKRIREQVFANK